jgi:hypothetical protein
MSALCVGRPGRALIWALLRMCGWQVLSSGLLQLAATLALFAAPMGVKGVLGFIQG